MVDNDENLISNEFLFGLTDNYSLTGNDKTINKLIILFILDKMEVILTESTLLDICCSSNSWIPYMDCKPLIPELIEGGLIYEIKRSKTEDSLYTLTPEGRICIEQFFNRIPISLRDNIAKFVNENRLKYKRKQEYDADYSKNADGTYMVTLKILDPIQPIMKLQINVPNKTIAKSVYKNWEKNAPNVYSTIYETIIE